MGNADRLREDARRICAAAVEAVDPAQCVDRALSHVELAQRRVWVVGMGKASARMAACAETLLGERVVGGLVITADGCGVPTQKVRVVEAGHPLPDARGVAAAEELAELVAAAQEGDRVLCLISGGGSALASLPAEGLTLDDLHRTGERLLRSGATIGELNVVRKHLEVLKGGGLARRAAPASVLSLILSDVVGDPLEAIASGPTAADPSTFGDARAVLQRYGLWEKVPPAVRGHIEAGCAGTVSETAKPGAAFLESVHNQIVGSGRTAAEAALRTGAELGYQGLLLSTTVEGEAREVGTVCGALAREVVSHGRPVSSPGLLVLAGETTVTVRGAGRGGRNQELALSAAVALEGWPDAVVCAFGTDGRDGPTDAAGAVVDGGTVCRIRDAGGDPREALAENNAYAVLEASGDLMITGPTGTNVADLYFVMVDKEAR